MKNLPLTTPDNDSVQSKFNEVSKKINILYMDEETSMMLAGVFGLYDQNIQFDNVVQDWFIISAQWAWNDGKVESISVLDDPEAFKKDHTNDDVVVRKLHELLYKADLVVFHNGNAFDMKKFNARAIKLGLEPIMEVKTFDTLLEARRKFKFTSNKLGDLCKILDVEDRKLKPDVPNAWIKATMGDPEAIKSIVTYGEGDIPTLREIFKKIVPWSPSQERLVKHFEKKFKVASSGPQ